MAYPKNTAEYIANEPLPVRKALVRMRSLVRKLAPEATEKLAWGMPTFCLEGNLLHFAAFKNHMSLFPGTDAIRRFKRDLGRFQTSKGTIQIPYETAIPTALVTKIVKYCVARNLAKAEAKKKKAKRPAKRKAVAPKRR